MKEACEGCINLADNDPQAVNIMIYYFYHLDYNALLPKRGESSLVDRSKMDKDRIAVIKPTDEPADEPVDEPINELNAHCKVYAIAEKYLISNLKALALQKFRAAALKSAF